MNHQSIMVDLGIFVIAAALLLMSACVVPGTQGCTPWHDFDEGRKCRTCPKSIECLQPIMKRAVWPENG
jgi:hypothetical protein